AWWRTRGSSPPDGGRWRYGHGTRLPERTRRRPRRRPEALEEARHAAAGASARRPITDKLRLTSGQTGRCYGEDEAASTHRRGGVTRDGWREQGGARPPGAGGGVREARPRAPDTDPIPRGRDGASPATPEQLPPAGQDPGGATAPGARRDVQGG